MGDGQAIHVLNRRCSEVTELSSLCPRLSGKGSQPGCLPLTQKAEAREFASPSWPEGPSSS